MSKYVMKIVDECGFGHTLDFDDRMALLNELNDWVKTHESGETPLYEITIEII